MTEERKKAEPECYFDLRAKEREAAGRQSGPRCDVYCRVIDNFGDAGVCYRLARALYFEHGYRVTLYIDNIATLNALIGDAPRGVLDSHAELSAPQTGFVVHGVPAMRIERCAGSDSRFLLSGGIAVREWNDCEKMTPGDIVIETFGCRLPDSVEEAIARKSEFGGRCVWFNLEYLSAEDWVEECHGLPSPHPRLPVSKTFFFPGFTERTGGVVIERGLKEARAAFGPEDRRAALTALGADPDAEFNLFFFSYPGAPVQELAKALASDPRPVQIVAAPGAASDLFAEAVKEENAPQVKFFRMREPVCQPEFDRLLWSMDSLIVRGEDSFVRAQLSGKPFLWTIYPQTEDTHIVKLKAFIERISASMTPQDARLWRCVSLAWNCGGLPSELWKAYRDAHASLGEGTRRWGERLEALGSLSDHLAEAAENRLK